MDTPYRWTKQVASHWGGTRNGTIVHWPTGIEAKGEIRNQFSHVIDIAATVLDAAGLPQPDLRPRRPADAAARREHGCRASTTPTAAEHRETQYFEMFVNRGIYHKGWTAVDPAQHALGDRAPSCRRSTTTSGSSTHPTTGPRRNDLAAENPEKLHELQRLFLIEAVRYGVLPLDDRRVERFEPRHRRPADAGQGQLADPLRRHGADHGELDHRHQEQVALGDRPDRQSPRAARRA